VMMVIKQPAVEASLADCSLNRLNLHTRHDTRTGLAS
jgi:hypothetical protein